MMILLVLSYFLYDDSLLFPSELQKQTPIGIIGSSNKDVRKKNIKDFVWLPGNQKDQVYEQDSIFTGDDSQASIQLSDGSVIKIEENSLVNLNTKNGQMQLDLRFGQFAGNGKTPLHIKTGNEEYTIQGNDAQFEINRSKTGVMDVKVLSGTAEISSKVGKQKLVANESLKISKHKTEKNEVDSEVEAKIHLLTKNDLLVIRGDKTSTDKLPISFEWKSQGPLVQYQIEIADTEDFIKILTLQSTAERKITLKDSFKEGAYFWRVKGLDIKQQTLAISEKHKFSLRDLAAPRIMTPDNQSTITKKIIPSDKELQTNTQIAWEADASIESFEWQLSKTAEFTEIINEKSLRGKSLTTPDLGEGTYFTRVRGFDKSKNPSQWSEVRVFNFAFQTEPKPPAPILAQKHIRFAIPKLEGRAPSTATSPQMAWSAVDHIKTYHWEIANNPRFTGAQAADTPATKAVWTQYKPGKFYFRVFARS
ncbi:MAG TPA: FecR family protein, partial [Pseudobdellovibrionaceae bacterium]